MYRKNLIALLLFVFCTLSANAQLQFGIKAGVSSSNIDVSSIMIDEPGLGERLELAVRDARYGIRGGIVIRANIGNAFLFQPELIFNSNTVAFAVEDLDNQGLGARILEEKYQNLDIPVLLGWQLGPLRFQFGPEGHVFLNSTSELFEFEDYDQNFSDLTVGYLVGVGLDIWNLTFDVRREGNFTKFGNHIRFAGQEFAFDDSPSRWLFSVGFLFGQKRK